MIWFIYVLSLTEQSAHAIRLGLQSTEGRRPCQHYVWSVRQINMLKYVHTKNTQRFTWSGRPRVLLWAGFLHQQREPDVFSNTLLWWDLHPNFSSLQLQSAICKGCTWLRICNELIWTWTGLLIRFMCLSLQDLWECFFFLIVFL